ncbi:hypothetical protein BC826DRAFT_966248 [Russula brevipes]|nr:hypothetical protein BC826DRAFT_966248 [Russula brevipes]
MPRATNALALALNLKPLAWGGAADLRGHSSLLQVRALSLTRDIPLSYVRSENVKKLGTRTFPGFPFRVIGIEYPLTPQTYVSSPTSCSLKGRVAYAPAPPAPRPDATGARGRGLGGSVRPSEETARDRSRAHPSTSGAVTSVPTHLLPTPLPVPGRNGNVTRIATL